MFKRQMINEMLEGNTLQGNLETYVKELEKCKKAYIEKVYTMWKEDKQHTSFYLSLLETYKGK